MPICGTITEEQKFDDSVNWEFEDENAVHELSSANNDGSRSATEQLSMGHVWVWYILHLQINESYFAAQRFIFYKEKKEVQSTNKEEAKRWPFLNL